MGLFVFFPCLPYWSGQLSFFIGKLDRIWIRSSSLGVLESILNLRMFVWRSCFSASASVWLHFSLEMKNKQFGSSALALSVWWIAFAALCFLGKQLLTCVLFFLSLLSYFLLHLSHLSSSSTPSFHFHQARTFSPTARRSARPLGTLTAAGCHLLCHPMGARGQTTVATCTCPAWMPRCRTLRYLPPSTFQTSSPWPRPSPRPTIGHSPPLARMVRGHSHTTAFTNTSISNNSSTAPAR